MMDFIKLCFKDVFMILDELATDDRQVKEEEERSGGQGQASPVKETFWQVDRHIAKIKDEWYVIHNNLQVIYKLKRHSKRVIVKVMISNNNAKRKNYEWYWTLLKKYFERYSKLYILAWYKCHVTNHLCSGEINTNDTKTNTNKIIEIQI